MWKIWNGCRVVNVTITVLHTRLIGLYTHLLWGLDEFTTTHLVTYGLATWFKRADARSTRRSSTCFWLHGGGLDASVLQRILIRQSVTRIETRTFACSWIRTRCLDGIPALLGLPLTRSNDSMGKTTKQLLVIGGGARKRASARLFSLVQARGPVRSLRLHMPKTAPGLLNYSTPSFPPICVFKSTLIRAGLITDQTRTDIRHRQTERKGKYQHCNVEL